MNVIPSLLMPTFRQTFQWITKPLEYLHKHDRECGDIFTVNLSGAFMGVVLTSSPQAIQQILTNDTKQLSAPGSGNQILKPFLGDRGVILLDGREHRQRRQLLMPQFHGDKVRVYTDAIQEITRDLIQGWQVGETLNVREEMQKITLSVILQTVFGLNKGDRYDRIRAKLSEMLSLVESPINAAFLFLPWLQKDLGAWSPWGRFVRDRTELDSLIYAEITERRQSGETDALKEPLCDRTDILSMLIGSQDADGNSMSDLELHDELMTLLFAGHETTATALAWAIYWINYLPEVKEKLLAEIATLGANPDAMAISKLPYLNAVCSETLRIYPVGMLTFPRIVNEPISIGGYELKPDTVVMGCIYLTHHREDLYPEAHLFKPERFLERQFSPYEYLPFGGGARRCIGVALAQLELKLVLVEILANCQLNLTGKLPVIPARRGVTLGPKGGVTVRVDAKGNILKYSELQTQKV
jgi:cytochrome P450 family 110